MLVRPAVILGFVNVAGQDVFQSDFLIGNFFCGSPRQHGNFRFGQRRIVQTQLVHQAREHLIVPGGDLLTVTVFADQQHFPHGRFDHGIGKDWRVGGFFSIQVERHRAFITIKYSRHMVPFVPGKAHFVCPQRKPVFACSHLEAQPSKPLIAQQDTLILRLIILADNGGQMGVAIGCCVGIVPFKSARRYPNADGKLTARYTNFFGIVGDIGGSSVKQQRSAGCANVAPLRFHGIGIGGRKILVLNVRILQVTA